MSKVKTRRKGTPDRPFFVSVVPLLLGCVLSISALSSCTASRTVTTTSQYQQKGDTTVIIQSKTIERYDGESRYPLAK